MAEERDFYTDKSVLLDPYTWFEGMRARGSVCRMPQRDFLVLTTSFKESTDVLNNSADYSSVLSVSGPLLPMPFDTTGEDLTQAIEAHRHKVPMSDLLVAKDDEAHRNSRVLIARLFTPRRLAEIESFMEALAEKMVKNVIAKGQCEVISELASPFVTFVVSDLLGVPEEDRDEFCRVIANAPPPGDMESAPPPGKEEEWAAHGTEVDQEELAKSPLAFMGGYFFRYITERRESPRKDLLTEFAQATYPDGTLPDVIELVRLSTFLFGAGQDTSAKLIGNAFRYLVEIPGLQQLLREDPSLIPAFIEEVLRLEGSIKTTKRLARRPTRIGDTEIPAGTKVVIGIAAANRDPQRWENPGEFQLNRPRIKEHLSFGRGAHTCAGAPLARVEVRILFEKLLQHTSHIDLVEAHHGKSGERRFEFEPSFSIRGLANLYAEFKPA